MINKLILVLVLYFSSSLQHTQSGEANSTFPKWQRPNCAVIVETYAFEEVS